MDDLMSIVIMHAILLQNMGGRLVWNQYITKRRENVGGMVYYISTVWKSGRDVSSVSPT